jgi:hypothetical protein
MWPAEARAVAARAGSGADLRRCVRVMPHDNDTGGFFVALLRKRSPWPPVGPSAEPRLHSVEQRAEGLVRWRAGGAVGGAVASTALAETERSSLAAHPQLAPLLRALASALTPAGGLVLCVRASASAHSRHEPESDAVGSEAAPAAARAEAGERGVRQRGLAGQGQVLRAEGQPVNASHPRLGLGGGRRDELEL